MPTKPHSDCSLDYIHQVLGITEKCPRRNCEGTLTLVLVSYRPGQKPVQEKECSVCSKVVRDKKPYNNKKYNNKNNDRQNNDKQKQNYQSQSKTQSKQAK